MARQDAPDSHDSMISLVSSDSAAAISRRARTLVA